MERFIEFEQAVTMDDLRQALAGSTSGILILRFSKLTGTVKIRTANKVSKRVLKRAFLPHRIRKVYDHFPIDRQETIGSAQ